MTQLFLLALLSAAGIVCWVTFVAPSTIAYFQPTVEATLQGLHAFLAGGHAFQRPRFRLVHSTIACWPRQT